MIFLILFLNSNHEKGVYLPQDHGADVAREVDMARRTCTDVTRHARPRGRACEAHAARRWRAGSANTWQGPRESTPMPGWRHGAEGVGI